MGFTRRPLEKQVINPTVRLRSQENAGTIKLADDIEPTDDRLLSIPWQKPPFKRFREILLPHGASRKELRRERPERRLRLVSAIARGRRWLDEIITGSVTDAEQIALREQCSVRHVNMTNLRERRPISRRKVLWWE